MEKYYNIAVMMHPTAQDKIAGEITWDKEQAKFHKGWYTVKVQKKCKGCKENECTACRQYNKLCDWAYRELMK